LQWRRDHQLEHERRITDEADPARRAVRTRARNRPRVSRRRGVPGQKWGKTINVVNKPVPEVQPETESRG